MSDTWIALISGFLSGTLTPLLIAWLQGRYQQPVTDAQAQEILSESWERLGKEYARQLEQRKSVEEEVTALRPLVLKLALQDKEMEQVHEDKEDWKRYAGKLEEQLKDANIIPLPFRRYPGNGDSQKMKAITPADIERHTEAHK